MRPTSSGNASHRSDLAIFKNSFARKATKRFSVDKLANVSVGELEIASARDIESGSECLIAIDDVRNGEAGGRASGRNGRDEAD